MTQRNNPPKAVLCWSGGKDAAYALHTILTEGRYEIKYLLTTLNANYKRVSLHGIRETLLDFQAAATGIPLIKIWLTEGSNEDYENNMRRVLSRLKKEGIEQVIFGDIYLEDIRHYREQNLAKANMTGVFPLWGKDTRKLFNDYLQQGFQSIICCVDNDLLGEEWLGQTLSPGMSTRLPDRVDPCGENGAYHTFCFKGPVFRRKVPFQVGTKVYRALEYTDDVTQETLTKGFWYCDLLPG